MQREPNPEPVHPPVVSAVELRQRTWLPIVEVRSDETGTGIVLRLRSEDGYDVLLIADNAHNPGLYRSLVTVALDSVKAADDPLNLDMLVGWMLRTDLFPECRISRRFDLRKAT